MRLPIINSRQTLGCTVVREDWQPTAVFATSKMCIWIGSKRKYYVVLSVITKPTRLAEHVAETCLDIRTRPSSTFLEVSHTAVWTWNSNICHAIVGAQKIHHDWRQDINNGACSFLNFFGVVSRLCQVRSWSFLISNVSACVFHILQSVHSNTIATI